MEKEIFSKYEKARILGARALQISMDAPILMKMDEEKLKEVNYDPLRIAEVEFESDVLPINIKRPMPEKKIEEIEDVEIEAENEDDAKKEEKEKVEEKEIQEGGEIMELAQPEEEKEDEEENKEKTADEIAV